MIEKRYIILFPLSIIIYTIAFCQGSDAIRASPREGLLVGNIKKCQCKMNEVLFNEKCESSKNLVPVWNVENETENIVDISQFSSITVEPLRCPEGDSKLHLNINHFVIYDDGYLHNLALDARNATKQYCIDHIKNDDGVTLQAEVCEPNPEIQVCCSPNYTQNHNDICTSTNYSINPSLTGRFSWENYTLSPVNIFCKDEEILYKEPLVPPDGIGAVLTGYPLGQHLQLNSIYLRHPEIKSSGEYCIEQAENNSAVVAKFCVTHPKIVYQKLCKNSTCIRKCCPEEYVYDLARHDCILYSYKMEYHFVNANLKEIDLPVNLEVTYGIPLCDENIFFINYGAGLINFDSNGSLLAPNETKFHSPLYCVDGFLNDSEDVNSSVTNFALACFPEIKQTCTWRWVIGSVLLGISCVFYVVTLVIYLAIEELRSRLVGKCLISQVTALLTTYLTLIFLQNTDSFSELKCNFPGTVEHIAILASFFWLNVMCYDMWSTIRSMRPVEDTTSTSRRRFLYYCLYAWGIPLFIASVRVIIDQLPPNEYLKSSQMQAHFGTTHCFFTGKFPVTKWIYLYGPILVLLFVNVIFFVNVAMIIVKSMNETAKLIQGPDSGQTGKNLSAKKERVIMYLKLFLVMGISWLLEIITWVAFEENECHFWGLDIVNMFQGVFIFVIFVCKKSTLEKVRQKFWCKGNTITNVYQMTDLQ